MKAEDLMLNDIVLFNNMACKIISINAHRDCVELYDVDDEDIFIVGKYAKHIQPITLTPEILEKNGFYVFKSKTSSYCEILLNINISDDTQFQISGRSVDSKWYMSIYKIKRLDHKGNNDSNCLWSSGLQFEYKEIYFHEVQHALRLCGLNELADNFKVLKGE